MTFVRFGIQHIFNLEEVDMIKAEIDEEFDNYVVIVLFKNGCTEVVYRSSDKEDILKTMNNFFIGIPNIDFAIPID